MKRKSKMPAWPRAARRASPEHDSQVALFEYAEIRAAQVPEWRCLFAVPNAGRRSKFQGMWLKREGMKPGVPDVWLPVARGAFYGCVLEMKSDTGRLTVEQREWLNMMAAEGWRTGVCRSAPEAIKFLSDYLAMPQSS